MYGFNEFGLAAARLEHQRDTMLSAMPLIEYTILRVSEPEQVPAMSNDMLIRMKVAMGMISGEGLEWDAAAVRNAVDNELRRRGLSVE